MKNNKGLSLIILVLIAIIVIVVGAMAIVLVINNNKEKTFDENSKIKNSTTNQFITNSNEKENNISLQDKQSKSIEKYAWKDFVISIEGNIITMGSKVSSLETFGFTPVSSNYNKELGKGQGLYTLFNFNKNSQVLDKLSCRGYNHLEETKPLKECELVQLDIDSDFIKNLDVVLPGGLLLKENSTIDDIVNSMGEYTKEIARTYFWTDENYSSIQINCDTDGKINSITYSFNIM